MMNQWPSVGVVIPTHDRPGPLRAAVDAVLHQDYPGRLRVVVVYDQAEPELEPDGSVTVLVNERTPGLAGARNTGIGALEDELVAFCDDDDVWRPGKLRAQVEALAGRPGWCGAIPCCGTSTRTGTASDEPATPRAAGRAGRPAGGGRGDGVQFRLSSYQARAARDH
jgi:glycosyltransferase involved in cell wall biosynthesis